MRSAITCGAVQRLCELSRSLLINFTVKFQGRLGDDSILKSTQDEILQLRNRQKCLEETIVFKQAEVGVYTLSFLIRMFSIRILRLKFAKF